MARRAPNEAALPGKTVPGVMTPKRTGGQALPNVPAPAREAAFRTVPGSNASLNKTAVRREPAFRTRPGSGSNV